MLEVFKENGLLTDGIIGELRNYRERHGLSKKDMAGLLGVDHVTISRWERGVTRHVQKAQCEAIVALLSSRFVGKASVNDDGMKPELSAMVAQICSIYSLCDTSEKRQSLFRALDDMETKLGQAIAEKKSTNVRK